MCVLCVCYSERQTERERGATVSIAKKLRIILTQQSSELFFSPCILSHKGTPECFFSFLSSGAKLFLSMFDPTSFELAGSDRC